MDFRTKVNIEFEGKTIDYSSKILSLGSCFSVHLGTILKNLKYDIFQNPLGITFNPISINTGIKRCLSSNSLPEVEVIQVNDLYAHHDFHGAFNHTQKDHAIKTMNLSLKRAKDFISTVDTVFITLGTAFVFTLDNKVVNNCHKRPANKFQQRLLSTKEIVDALNETIINLQNSSPKTIQFIFSLSPVRHIKNGLSNNQLSKARLKDAIHQICDINQNCHYFPAYEIVLDELRDYRFYADDMIHPSQKTVQYIFESFEESCLSQDEYEIRKKISKINSQLNHKALHPSSDEYLKFKRNLLSEIESFEDQSDFDFSEEKEMLVKSA